MKWYRNLKFRWKVALICVAAGLIPMLLLGFYCFRQINSLLENREAQALEETLTQAAGSLNQRLDSFQNAMELAAWDKDLGQAVNRVYRNNYEMYETYQYVVEPLFLQVRTVNPNILSGTLYTSANLYPHGSTVRPEEEAHTQPWYAEASVSQRPMIYVEPGKTLLFISPVLSSGLRTQNYLVMQVDYRAVFSPLDTLLEGDYSVYLLDDQDREVYSYQSGGLPSGMEMQKALSNGHLNQEYMTAQRTLSDSGWSMMLYRPMRVVYANTQELTLTVLLVAAGCALLLYIMAQLLSLAVVRPLEALSRNMRGIGEGDLSVTILPTPQRNDEVGLLMHQFTWMVERLQYLINEVYKNRIARQEYEMKALQAQINPHFFYNSLSLINSKAIMAGQEDISNMAQLLSTFYRTTLNHGKSGIPVVDEWTNTMSYAKIQLMMHRDSFDLVEQLDPETHAYIIPNLLLQPLMENAIAHGIDHKVTPGRGWVELVGVLRDGCLVFTVRDNGCGIPQEKLSSLLTTESKGYGVQNVHRRVQLYYGQEYGLTYESTVDGGTTATLILPAKRELTVPTQDSAAGIPCSLSE